MQKTAATAARRKIGPTGDSASNARKLILFLYTRWSISSDSWVRMTLILAVPPLPGSAWAGEKLAEQAEQLGKIMEHHM